MALTEKPGNIKETDAAGPLKNDAAREAGTQGGGQPAPFSIKKSIGSTVYEVEVRFNPKSRETMGDKILRIVRGGAGGKAGGK
jgi:hypothetical protein